MGKARGRGQRGRRCQKRDVKQVKWVLDVNANLLQRAQHG